MKSTPYAFWALIFCALVFLGGCSSTPEKEQIDYSSQLQITPTPQPVSKEEVNRQIIQAVQSLDGGDWESAVFQLESVLKHYHTDDKSLELNVLTVIALIQTEHFDYDGANHTANKIEYISQGMVYLPRITQLVILMAEKRQGQPLEVNTQAHANPQLLNWFKQH